MGKFSDLPGEIMLDIFTRLPVESVLDCKLVSKMCRTVVQHPSFVRLHSNRLLLSNPDSTPSDSAAVSGKLSFILKMRDVSEAYTKRLYYLEYDAEVCSHRLRKLKLNPPLHFIYSIIGSCNGLVCIIGLPKHHTLDTATSSACVVFISNPVTRECITLEELDRATHYHPVDFVLYGFGYVASTNEYKVVRLYTFWREDEDEDKFAQVEVYTLGSGKGWRKAGNINVGSALFGRQHAEFVNGFLHWDLLKGKTVAFDLANEVCVGYSEFQNGRLWCGVLGGYFCGTLYGEDNRNSDIWVLKKKKDESFSWSWSQEFSLTDTDPYTTSLALTSSGTVLCYSDTKLNLYDLESSSTKLIEDFGRGINSAIPHMNSLVSLRAFGEDNTRTLEFGESVVEDPKVGDWQMRQQ